MAITNNDGTIVVTGAHINLFQLLSLEGRLKLEIAGLKFREATAPHVRYLIESNTKNKAKLLEELKAYRLTMFPIPEKKEV